MKATLLYGTLLSVLMILYEGAGSSATWCNFTGADAELPVPSEDVAPPRKYNWWLSAPR